MKHIFRLAQFPDSTFELDTSVWTGKTTLMMDNQPIERSDERGKPFLIPTDQGYVKALPKPSFPDPIPAFDINGEKIQLAEPLKWYQYAIGSLPVLLLFVGGALGGAIGAVGAFANFKLFREDGNTVLTYLKVFGVVLGSGILYVVLASFFASLLR